MTLRLVLSLVMAQVTMALVWLVTPRGFNPSTDLMGYPLFANFNIDLYFKAYLLEAIGMPLFAAWIFLRLRRHRFSWEQFTPVWFESWLKDVPEPKVSPTTWASRVGRMMRLWFTGFVFGLGTVCYGHGNFFAQTLLVAVLYGGLVYGAALWIRRRVPDGNEIGASWVNALFSAAIPFVLYGASQATRVGTDGHPWFPFWLAAAATVGLAVWISRRLGRVRDAASAAALERKVFFGLVFPVFIFVLTAETPVARTWLHLHHDGESLVTSLLLRQGGFPWRDFLFQHGLLQDPIFAWVGHRFFEDTVWGADAGVSLIAKPLFFLSQYVLLCLFFRRRPWLLTLTAVLLPWVWPIVFDGFNFRFLFLYPLFFLATLALARRSARLAAFTGAGAIALVVATPEALFVPFGLFCGFFGFEAFNRIPSERWFKALRITKAGLAGGTLFLVGWLAFLAVFGALGAYISCYVNLAAGHIYAVGIPIPWKITNWFTLAVLFPWIVYFSSLLFLAFRVRAGKLLPLDAVMFGWNVFAILYYRKFLARADEHILAHVSLALPLVYWMMAEGVAWVDRQWEHRLPAEYRGRGLQPMGLALMAVLLIPLSRSVWWHFESLPARYAKPAAVRSSLSRWGYGELGKDSLRIVRELRDFFVTHKLAGEKVFDFTNEPALFHYLLELPVPLRHQYPYANAREQRRIGEELDREKPEWIVYLSSAPFARFDGVPAQTRYYELSRQVLKSYRVFAVFSHHVILIRDDLRREKVAVRGLVDNGQANFFEGCDWGFALAHGLAWRTGRADTVLFSTSSSANGQMTEIQLPRDKASKAEALEIEFERVVPDAFTLSDGHLNVSSDKGAINFRTLTAGRVAYRVPVSSCLQWKAFTGDTLYLAYLHPQEIRAIRLIGATTNATPDRTLSSP